MRQQPVEGIFQAIKCNEKLIKILKKYNITGLVKATIGINNKNEIVYCIDEPEIKGNEQLFSEVSKLIDIIFSTDIDLSEIYDPRILKELSSKYQLDYHLLSSNMTKIIYFLNRILSGYGKIYPLIKDKNIEEVVVNKPDSYAMIFHRFYNYTWIRTNVFLNSKDLDDIVIRLAHIAGRELSIAHPYVEAPLPDGNRIAATFSNEITRFGTSLVIRKHLEEPLTPSDLIRSRLVSSLYVAYLWLLLRLKATIIIAGPTASGKTTLLQALLLLIPPTDRIVTIEDTPEINLKHHENWDSLVTRIVSGATGESIDILDLTKFALRRRPDYFVIGEVRGEEARTLIHAAASGHGALTTFHADSAPSVIQRLKAEPIHIGESFLQLIWSIVVLKRVKVRDSTYARRVVEIYEVKPAGDKVELLKVAAWNKEEDILLPDSIEELLDKSYRLDTISKILFISKDEIIQEILELKNILEKCVKCSYKVFIETIRKYYIKRQVKVLNNEYIQNQ